MKIPTFSFYRLLWAITVPKIVVFASHIPKKWIVNYGKSKGKQIDGQVLFVQGQKARIKS